MVDWTYHCVNQFYGHSSLLNLLFYSLRYIILGFVIHLLVVTYTSAYDLLNSTVCYKLYTHNRNKVTDGLLC